MHANNTLVDNIYSAVGGVTHFLILICFIEQIDVCDMI